MVYKGALILYGRGWYRKETLEGLGHDLRGYQGKRTFPKSKRIRNPKSKRNEVEEISADNLVFSFWLLVVWTIILNSNLSA